MRISRRKFLETGALFTVAVGASLAVPSIIKGQINKDTLSYDAKGVYENSSDPLSVLTKNDFEQLIKTRFEFVSGAVGRASLTLVQVEDLVRSKDGIDANGREGFSLLFRGKEANLTQDTYTVTHQSLGAFQLFIVPVSSKRSGHYYEAIINRLHY